MSIRDDLEDLFPNLKHTPYRIASPRDLRFNCIAWAARDNEAWWEPDQMGICYWPQGAPREYTLDAYVRAFQSLGFQPCVDESFEPGFEKIAIYAAKSQPKHAARQLSSDRWTSKIGKREDIEHTLPGLESSDYGSVARILKRPLNPT